MIKGRENEGQSGRGFSVGGKGGGGERKEVINRVGKEKGWGKRIGC